MNPTRDTALGAGLIVVLFVLYVRGVPQAIYNAVRNGGTAPTDVQAGEAVGGAGQTAPYLPSGASAVINDPGAGPPAGVAPTMPAAASPAKWTPVDLIPGWEAIFQQFQWVPVAGKTGWSSEWYDNILPCAQAKGSFDGCLPKG